MFLFWGRFEPENVLKWYSTWYGMELKLQYNAQNVKALLSPLGGLIEF